MEYVGFWPEPKGGPLDRVNDGKSEPVWADPLGKYVHIGGDTVHAKGQLHWPRHC